jgi:hypothetical protein
MSSLRECITSFLAPSIRVSRRGLLAGGAAMAASSVFPRPFLALAQTQPPKPTTSAFEHLVYGGNGTVPVDSGLPNVGIFYGVERSTWNLRWYRYTGGNDGRFQPNSYNPIGNGWGEARHVLGCGNGVILVVKDTGGLYWYQYLGNGEDDSSAATGWHPNSGNQIGNGWGSMSHVFVNPAEGRDPQYPVIYAVTDSGALRWFLYQGEGEHNPSASTGWHPNSGNQIGYGWGDAVQVTGIGRSILATRADGGLYWFLYQGGGESDPIASTGWHPNSGNQIGNGWGSIQHLFGGNTGSFQSVFMVDENGILKWYGYDGTGVHDPSGATGWSDGSGYTIAWDF